MPIPVASEPVIPPPRPELGRSASADTAAPFEQLLDAAAPAADAKPSEPARDTRRREARTHGDDVPETRSNQPSGSDQEPARAKGRDKAPPPRPEAQSNPAADAETPAEPGATPATEDTAAGVAIVDPALLVAVPPTGEVALPEGDGATAEVPSEDAAMAMPAPAAPPQAAQAATPTPAIAAAIAPATEPAATAEAPAADPLAGRTAPVAAAPAGGSLPAGAGTSGATGDAEVPVMDAEPALAAAVEADGEQPAKPPTAPARERPAQAAVSAAPETADAMPAGNDSEPAPVATREPQAPGKEALLRAAPQPAGEPAAKPAAEAAPAGQTTPATVTAHMPLPTMWPAALRVASSPDLAVPVTGLAVEIAARVQDGQKSFQIRLDPPELGRVDVRLDVDRGGSVTTRLTVDRVETLDLLRRDSSTLERALQQAGLKTDGGLEFSLRDQSLAHREQQDRDPGTAQSRIIVPDDEAAAAEAARRGYGRLIGLGGGVDIRV